MEDNRRNSLILSLVTCFFWFAAYTYVPILTTYSEAMGASHKMAGLIAGSYGFAQMVLRIPIGIISDKINRRKPFIIAGICFGLFSCLGLWMYDSPFMILVFRSSAGAAASAWVTYTVLYSSYYEKAEAPKAIGIINSFTSFGQMTAMMLGGLAAQYFGQRAPFLLGAAGAAAGLAISLKVKENSAAKREPLGIKQILKAAGDLRLLLVSFLAVLSQLLTFATVFAFTPVVAQNLGADSFQLGLLTTLSTLPGIFASAMSGLYFTKRLGERKTIVFGFLLSAAACAAIPYAPGLLVLYVSQIIGGFGRGLVFPLLMGLSIKTVEEGRRATAMGFFQAIYSLGMFAGPVMVGFLSETAGLTFGFWTVAFIGLAGAAIAALFIKNETAD